jgi:hypothetical protein
MLSFTYNEQIYSYTAKKVEHSCFNYLKQISSFKIAVVYGADNNSKHFYIALQ